MVLTLLYQGFKVSTLKFIALYSLPTVDIALTLLYQGIEGEYKGEYIKKASHHSKYNQVTRGLLGYLVWDYLAISNTFFYADG